MNFVAQMKRASKQVATECSVLFASVPGLEVSALSEELCAILAIQSLAIEGDDFTGPNRVVAFRAAACEVTIELSETIRPRAAYFDALDWPLLHRTFPEVEDRLAKHMAQVHITVETEYDAIAGAGRIGLGATHYARAQLAGAVVTAICRLATPLAIHWKSCEMLFHPESFVAALDTDPVSAFVRATPFSSNREIDEVRLIGASTRGASEFLGTEAVLEEAPLPLDWVMATLSGFVSHCRDRGAYPPHLEKYLTETGDQIVVRHLAATPEIVEPHVSLEVCKAPAFGFDIASADFEDLRPPRRAVSWNGVERRSRPKSAKTFGRRGLR
ncbi:hypothetical protein [Oricola sp.]|uniref:hypothetical protein n=1 Tax=Oricola sp. TaxID=1979950 RepID=UPI003BAC9863